IALRLVALVQVLDRDVGRTADALGDFLAGHLEMHAARMGALGAVHGEELLHLLQDGVEVAGLLSLSRRAPRGLPLGAPPHPPPPTCRRASPPAPAAAASLPRCRRPCARS